MKYTITDYQQIGDQPVESLEHSAPSCRPGALDLFYLQQFSLLGCSIGSLVPVSTEVLLVTYI